MPFAAWHGAARNFVTFYSYRYSSRDMSRVRTAMFVSLESRGTYVKIAHCSVGGAPTILLLPDVR